MQIAGFPDKTPDRVESTLEKLRTDTANYAPVQPSGAMKDSMNFERLWGMSSWQSKDDLASKMLSIGMNEFLNQYNELYKTDPVQARAYIDKAMDPSKAYLGSVHAMQNDILSHARTLLSTQYGIDMPEEFLQQFILKRYADDVRQHIENQPKNRFDKLLMGLPNFAASLVGDIAGGTGLSKIAELGATVVIPGTVGWKLGTAIGTRLSTKLAGTLGMWLNRQLETELGVPIIDMIGRTLLPSITSIFTESAAVKMGLNYDTEYLINPVRKELGLPELEPPSYLDNLFMTLQQRGYTRIGRMSVPALGLILGAGTLAHEAIDWHDKGNRANALSRQSALADRPSLSVGQFTPRLMQFVDKLGEYSSNSAYQIRAATGTLIASINRILTDRNNATSPSERGKYEQGLVSTMAAWYTYASRKAYQEPDRKIRGHLISNVHAIKRIIDQMQWTSTANDSAPEHDDLRTFIGNNFDGLSASKFYKSVSSIANEYRSKLTDGTINRDDIMNDARLRAKWNSHQKSYDTTSTDDETKYQEFIGAFLTAIGMSSDGVANNSQIPDVDLETLRRADILRDALELPNSEEALLDHRTT
ncbi:MAG: hypothetical protein ACRCX2_10525 [Paraclostridium sp.]